MDEHLRAEIFRLRAEGLSFARIGEQLDLPKGVAYREFKRPAPSGPAPHQGSPRGAAHLDQALAADPELVERRRALESERLELQRLELQARRLETEARLTMLQGKGGGSDGQLAALIVTEMGRFRDDIKLALTRSAPPPQQSVTGQLEEWRRGMEMMKAFAPASAPSSAVDLEFRVAMERIKSEDQRITRQLEAEMEERRERLNSQRTRDEAVATAIQNTTPLLTAFMENWLREKNEPARPPALPAGETPALRVVNEVEGACPRCGGGLAIVPGDDDRCPNCQAPLVVVEGEIRERQVAPEPTSRVPTFAS